jgi:hypothetical protein
MSYPDNSFELDQLEVDQYGGAEADLFDGNAWTFITGLARSITRVVLRNVRVSWSGAVVLVQAGVAIGDVLAIDLSRDALDPITQAVQPYVQRYADVVTAGGTPQVLGVCVAAAAAGKKAQIATGGVLPPSITGLSAMTGGALVSVNATTSKLQAWTAGDDALGYTSPLGSVLLMFAGRVAS